MIGATLCGQLGDCMRTDWATQCRQLSTLRRPRILFWAILRRPNGAGCTRYFCGAFSSPKRFDLPQVISGISKLCLYSGRCVLRYLVSKASRTPSGQNGQRGPEGLIFAKAGTWSPKPFGRRVCSKMRSPVVPGHTRPLKAVYQHRRQRYGWVRLGRTVPLAMR